MSGWFSDHRQVLRSLARSPGFSVAAILTLAVGGGACTAMLSATYRLLLRPLPFPAPDRLVALPGASLRGRPGRPVDRARRCPAAVRYRPRRRRLAGSRGREDRSDVAAARMSMAGVACMFTPFGTILGVLTIIVLVRLSVKEFFGQRSSAAA